MASSSNLPVCPECGTPVSGGRGTARSFCSREHKDAWNLRARVEGKAIIAVAKAWRLAKASEKGALLTLMGRLLEPMAKADKEAGRKTSAYVDALYPVAVGVGRTFAKKEGKEVARVANTPRIVTKEDNGSRAPTAATKAKIAASKRGRTLSAQVSA